MSTKIYNAFTYDGDMVELLSDLQQIKSEYLEYKKKKIAELFLDSKIDHFLDLCLLIQGTIEQGLNVIVNPTASAVIYPHPDNIYVQFFGVEGHEINLNDKFSDYHYQNQTDMPDDVTVEEWHEREEVWEEILGGDAPANRGYSFDFTHQYIAWDIAEYILQEKGLLKRG